MGSTTAMSACGLCTKRAARKHLSKGTKDSSFTSGEEEPDDILPILGIGSIGQEVSSLLCAIGSRSLVTSAFHDFFWAGHAMARRQCDCCWHGVLSEGIASANA